MNWFAVVVASWARSLRARFGERSHGVSQLRRRQLDAITERDRIEWPGEGVEGWRK